MTLQEELNDASTAANIVSGIKPLAAIGSKLGYWADGITTGVALYQNDYNAAISTASGAVAGASVGYWVFGTFAVGTSPGWVPYATAAVTGYGVTQLVSTSVGYLLDLQSQQRALIEARSYQKGLCTPYFPTGKHQTYLSAPKK